MESESSSLRGKVIPVINEFIEKYGDLALQAILIVCEKFLMNHEEAHTTQIINGLLGQVDSTMNNEIPENMREKIKGLIKLSSCNARN